MQLMRTDLTHLHSSFGQLAECVNTKLERGLTRRVLESKGDVDEVQDLMVKISMRIESFLVSTDSSSYRVMFSCSMTV